MHAQLSAHIRSLMGGYAVQEPVLLVSKVILFYLTVIFYETAWLRVPTLVNPDHHFAKEKHLLSIRRDIPPQIDIMAVSYAGVPKDVDMRLLRYYPPSPPPRELSLSLFPPSLPPSPRPPVSTRARKRKEKGEERERELGSSWGRGFEVSVSAAPDAQGKGRRRREGHRPFVRVQDRKKG